MLGPDNVIDSNHLPLLTLTGRVSVYFLDGHVLEGDLASQDAFNIFLLIEAEPVMIPRSQIRFIKGKQGQPIEVDTSHTLLKSGQSSVAVVQSDTITQEFTVQPKPVDQELQLPEEEPREFDEEGTMIMPPPELQFEDEEDMFADEDSTVILPLHDDDDEEHDVKEDSGTMILAPMIDDSDQTDTTLVVDIDSLPELLGEDEDATMVLGDEPQGKEMAATLTCISGPHTGDVAKLKNGITTIGRSTDNTIVLNKDKEISRHHAIILREIDQFVIQDQNSLNGTFVNNEQITSPRYLEDGDIILVGVSSFRYQED